MDSRRGAAPDAGGGGTPPTELVICLDGMNTVFVPPGPEECVPIIPPVNPDGGGIVVLDGGTGAPEASTPLDARTPPIDAARATDAAPDAGATIDAGGRHRTAAQRRRRHAAIYAPRGRGARRVRLPACAEHRTFRRARGVGCPARSRVGVEEHRAKATARRSQPEDVVLYAVGHCERVGATPQRPPAFFWCDASSEAMAFGCGQLWAV
ncbi:MAG TPA: hypothetical protein VK550_20500 [Polyangiaceae bacterium]|nr:hypothetical protein [Polyangiaceae bacterium]